jgi:beta-1,4-mannooligosaccharide/beta-1,4-mannosyl-N-acetylglucosamine phosphorylase
MSRIIGPALPNIPWEAKPRGYASPVWRYSANPIIKRDAIPSSNSVFNSAAVPFRGKFAGVFRCDDKAVEMNLFAGFSDDGYCWKISHEPITFQGDPEINKLQYRYDARVCRIDDKYYITWCNGYHGPTIGIAWTEDFEQFHQLENAFLPYNRNGVLFPRKINGEYVLLSRPSDTGHTPFGDIYCSRSKDLVYWGRHRYVFGTAGGWQSTKVGPGPTPIETDEGWLMIYHGVLTSCNGFVYRMGAALLDIDEPWKVLSRAAWYILGPELPYEQVGDVPNVTFPCAALTDADTGRICIYYGCADTVTGLAFTTADELLQFIKAHPMDLK